jgi:hypothetical protein
MADRFLSVCLSYSPLVIDAATSSTVYIIVSKTSCSNSNSCNGGWIRERERERKFRLEGVPF